MHARILTSLVCLALTACATTDKTIDKTTDKAGDKSGLSSGTTRLIESKTVPGLQLELLEVLDQDTYVHSSREAKVGGTQYVDRKARLELHFGASERAASAQLQELELLVTGLSRLADEYIAINRAAGSAADKAAAEAVKTRAREFRSVRNALLQKLRTAGIIPTDPAAFNAWLFEHFPDDEEAPADDTAGAAEVGSDEDDGGGILLAGIRSEIESRLESVRARLAATEKEDKDDDILVTVRATLDPEVGPPLFLEVPDYFVKGENSLSDETVNSRDAEFAKLKAEFEGAKSVVALIREVDEKSDLIKVDLRESLSALRHQFIESIDAFLKSRKELIEAILASDPTKRPAGTDEDKKFWDDLSSLSTRLNTIANAANKIKSLSIESPDLSTLDSFLAIAKEITLAWNGKQPEAKLFELADSIIKRLPTIITKLPNDSEVRKQLDKLRDAGEGEWIRLLKKWDNDFPEARKAIARLKTLGLFVDATDDLPDDLDGLIPHTLKDLPEAILDLPENPMTPGDKLQLEVQFWNRKEYDDARKAGSTPTPKETITYDAKIMKSGWLWSGDVIFARPFSGSDEQFNANAAVSYEYRAFDRYEPRFWKPGLGFHAAQLNFDTDETVEIGAGLSVSLWDGLLRVGVGYNISADDGQEYWFFGFGVISALDKIKSIGTDNIND